MNTNPSQFSHEGKQNLEYIARCPGCSADRITSHLDLEIEMFRLWRCKECALIFLNPRPSSRTLSRFYESQYWGFPGNASPRPWLVQRTQQRNVSHYYRYRERLLLQHCRRKTFLEIGCGDAQFLSFLKARGWLVQGLEMATGADKFSTNRSDLQIIEGDFMTLDLPREKFEHIGLFHVLEHICDPALAVSRLFSLLKSKGVLFLEVPNIDSLQARVFKSQWSLLAVPGHVNHFSPDTLSALLTRSGFRVEHLTHEPNFAGLTGWRDSFLMKLRSTLTSHPITFSPRYEPLIARPGTATKKAKVGRALVYQVFLNPILFLPLTLEWLLARAGVIMVCARKP